MTLGGARPALVGAVSEEDLLDVIQDALAPVGRDAHWPAGSVPPGDDAAVVPAPRGAVAVSTDAMGEGTDFLRVWPAGVRTRGFDVGWKAAAQNLSDINAMAAAPSALVTALTLPEDTPVEWVGSLARGIAAAVQALGADGCRVAGGDLGTGERIQVSVTALGDPHPDGVLRRTPSPADLPRIAGRGADLVHAQAPAVTASPDDSAAAAASASPWDAPGPGWAAAGLALLLTPRAELEARWEVLAPTGRPGPRELARAVRAQLRPRPPLGLGALALTGGALALMDVSDGLGRDAHRLARATSTAAGAALEPWVDARWLEEAAAPLAKVAALADVDPRSHVLGGGEDYGLLGLVHAGAPTPAGFTRIGRLAPAGETPAGHVELPERGWDHFAGSAG